MPLAALLVLAAPLTLGLVAVTLPLLWPVLLIAGVILLLWIGVALFISAGTLGLACGPPYFSGIVASVGLEGLVIAMLPAT